MGASLNFNQIPEDPNWKALQFPSKLLSNFKTNEEQIRANNRR
jgi:hypothetical protein